MTIERGEIIGGLCDGGPTGAAIGRNLDAGFNQIRWVESPARTGATAIGTKPTTIKECREAEGEAGDLLWARSRPNYADETYPLAAICPATEIIDRCIEVVVVYVMSHAAMKKGRAGAGIDRGVIAHNAGAERGKVSGFERQGNEWHESHSHSYGSAAEGREWHTFIFSLSCA